MFILKKICFFLILICCTYCGVYKEGTEVGNGNTEEEEEEAGAETDQQTDTSTKDQNTKKPIIPKHSDSQSESLNNREYLEEFISKLYSSCGSPFYKTRNSSKLSMVFGELDTEMLLSIEDKNSYNSLAFDDEEPFVFIYPEAEKFKVRVNKPNGEDLIQEEVCKEIEETNLNDGFIKYSTKIELAEQTWNLEWTENIDSDQLIKMIISKENSELVIQ